LMEKSSKESSKEAADDTHPTTSSDTNTIPPSDTSGECTTKKS